MPMILKKRRSDFAFSGKQGNTAVLAPDPNVVADARKSLRKIVVYLAERAAVEDHRQEVGGE